MVRRYYKFGPYRLDPTARTLLRGDEAVNLTPKAVETLRVLVQRHGIVVSKEMLLNEVWPGIFVDESGLTRNICDLRRALRDFEGDGPIQTVHKRGYRFVAEVIEQEERPEDYRKIVSVLPFHVIDQQTDPTVAVRIREAILSRLAHFPSLCVKSFDSADQSAPHSGTPILRIDHLLDGCLQSSDGLIRLSVRLEDSRQRNTVWAETFEERATNAFEFEDAFAEEVAGALSLLLSTEQPKLLSRRYTESHEAYRLYLRGRFHWNQRSNEEMHKAISYFRLAIAEDADYAPAYSALSSSYSFLPMLSSASSRELMPRAKAAAISALEIDDSLAEAKAVLAFVKWHYEWKWKDAELEYQRILKFVPSSAIARQWYGLLLAEMGRAPEALKQASMAAEIDPSPSIRANQATVLYLLGRAQEAEENARQTLVDFPGSVRARLVLALALEQLHRVPEALRELEEVHRKAPDAPLVRGALGHAYAASGRMDEAQQILNHLERLPRGQSDFYSRAMVYAGLGEVSRAIGEFEKACERREFHLVLLGVDRRLDPLRSHPEFKAVLEQIGLA